MLFKIRQNSACLVWGLCFLLNSSYESVAKLDYIPGKIRFSWQPPFPFKDELNLERQSRAYLFSCVSLLFLLLLLFLDVQKIGERAFPMLKATDELSMKFSPTRMLDKSFFVLSLLIVFCLPLITQFVELLDICGTLLWNPLHTVSVVCHQIFPKMSMLFPKQNSLDLREAK